MPGCVVVVAVAALITTALLLGGCSSVNSPAAPDQAPVLLLTDIGADIDDTEALLTILGSPSLRLVGVVTTVGDGAARGALARGWLRLLGVPDHQVPIAPGASNSDADHAGCTVPEGFPAPAEAALLPAGGATRLILDLAREHAGRLVVLANAPLTPIAHALKADKHGLLRAGLRHLYVQGNVHVHAATGWLEPDAQAYNFRVDMEAAKAVLLGLQATVDVSVIGNFAAYRVDVTQRDLHALEKAHLPSVLLAARAQMDKFRHSSPDLFYKIYPIPEARRSDWDWYEYLPGDAISHPYDPLVVLAAAEDASGSGSSHINQGSIFAGVSVRGRHMLMGNTRHQDGVPNPDRVHEVLLRSMRTAVESTRQQFQSERQ